VQRSRPGHEVTQDRLAACKGVQCGGAGGTHCVCFGVHVCEQGERGMTRFLKSACGWGGHRLPSKPP
jgi:hypothetical protein